MTRPAYLRRIGLLALLVLAVPARAQDDWPQWRGPTGQGTTTATNLPGGSLTVRWKTALLGEGVSSPIVHKGRVYVTTAFRGEAPHAWNESAALLVMIVGGCVAAFALLRLPAIIRSAATAVPSISGRLLFGVFCLGAVLAVALTTTVLVKPKWFWQFPDVWSGNDEHLAPAELEIVERLNLRPIIVLFVGSMSLIFAHLAMSSIKGTAVEDRPLSRWWKVVTFAGTLIPAVAAVQIARQPDWFFAAGQPWLSWIVTGGLGLLGLGATIGWLAERSLLRAPLAAAGLGAAAWLYFNTPTNEFAIVIDRRIRLGYVLPGSLLCLGQLWVLALARWPIRAAAIAAQTPREAPAVTPSEGPPVTPTRSASEGPAVTQFTSVQPTPTRGASEAPAEPQSASDGDSDLLRGSARPDDAGLSDWPISTAPRPSILLIVAGWVLPLLMSAQAAALFVRCNYLLPEVGMVRAVLCFDANDGRLLWKTLVYADVAEKKHTFNSYATPTPACDDDGVYVYFGSGLAGLDRNGRVRWLLRDEEFHRYSRYGTGSSLALSGDWLVVYNDSEFQGHGGHLDDDIQTQEGRRPSSLSVHHKKTGERRWSVSPPFSHDSYMTPLVWEQNGEQEIVVATWKTLAGFSLKDGSVRWTRSYPMQQVVPSLAVNGDCLFVTGGNYQPYPVYAIRPEEGTLWSVNKGGANIVSPVCLDGRLYTVDHGGILYCRDADSGRLRWQQRLHGRCLGSLAAGDGKIFAVDQEGNVYVVDAQSSDVLAQFALEENCAATPALAAGCIFVRTENHLWCLGKE